MRIICNKILSAYILKKYVLSDAQEKFFCITYQYVSIVKYFCSLFYRQLTAHFYIQAYRSLI